MAVGIGSVNTSQYFLETKETMPSIETKPPYSVPSMAKIAAIPWNGFNVVSLFSGCGGSSLGYKMAGFRVLWANEFIPAAQDTYRANHSDTMLDTRDIRQVSAQDILNATRLNVGELDLLDGSPPCASFSTAGKREAGWGKVKAYSDTKQRVDDLFFEYARLLKGLQPKVFVAENVSGLVKGVAKGYFLEILKALKNCGYNVKAKLLDAQWLGVPQMRQRIIFIGVRKDLGLEPRFPTPLSYRYSVRDAIPWITAISNLLPGKVPGMQDASLPSETVTTGDTGGNGRHAVEVDRRAYLDKRGAFGHEGDITEQPAPTILSDSIGTHWIVEPSISIAKGSRSIDDSAPSVLTHEREHTTSELTIRQGNKNGHSSQRGAIDDSAAPTPTIIAGGGSGQFVIEQETDISAYAIGREWDTLAPGEQSEKYYQLVRAGLDTPSQTITQRGGDNTVASVTHPTEKRKFSIAELKRICAFPDDFILTGTYAQQWERLGRAVPPIMMSHIARVIRDEILCKIP